MISCLVHTYNEEKNIGRCLKSLKFATEIIVIDMGSTDKTLEIARNHPVKIYSHPYTGYVEPARNFGIKKAKSDWILIVDADEVISDKLKTEIMAITQDKSNLFSYYRIARQNIIFNKWIKYSGWWPDYQVRLFKNGSVNWSEKIHGIPITRGIGKDIKPIQDLAIIHNNYKSISQFLDRLNRYTSVQALELFQSQYQVTLSDLILKPTNEFVTRFFMLGGYKDGFHGFALSALQAFSEIIVVLKVWEHKGFLQKNINLEDYGNIESTAEKIKKYWLLTELLKNKPDKFKEFFLKIRRYILS